MINQMAKRAAPVAALAMGLALSACSFSVDFGDVEGVPLAELDTSGDAPEHIALAGPDKVVITEGSALSITLDGSEEAGDALRFDRSGDKLTIARDQNVYDGRDKAIVRIEMPAPSRLDIAGSGEIEAEAMAVDSDIDIAGSGDITIASIEAESLDVDLSGSGTVTAAGTAEQLSIDIAGAGKIRFGELTADDVKIDIAGSGKIDLASDGTVDAEIAGSGDITVTGSATCSVETAGSGSLTCRPASPNADADEASDENATEE